MGTALQHSVDLLTVIPKNNIIDCNKSFINNTVNTPNLFQDSMDRMLEQYNRESVRMMILKHEEIFKDQVRELHRLYKVQKMLMAELRNSERKLESRTVKRVGSNCITTDSPMTFWSIGTTSETNQFSNKANTGFNIHELCTLRANPYAQAQSSSCTRDTSKMLMGIDLEQPVEEDISAIKDEAECNSVRSLKDKMTIPSPCLFTDGENEVELTLSIGFATNKKEAKNQQSYSSVESGSDERTQKNPVMSIKTDREECNDCTNSSSTAKHPPWLFPTLSLNRT